MIWITFFFISLGILAALQYYLDGRIFIVSAFEKFRLATRTLDQWNYLYKNSSEKSDIIISLTTIPARLKICAPTIKSLLAQSKPPARIIFWIPGESRRYNEKYEIPAWLLNLDGIEIRQCEDMGPATKFLHAVREFSPDTRILIADDDKIYPHTFLVQIEKLSNRYPDYALGYSGWRVPEDFIDRPSTLWMNIMRLPPFPIKCSWVSNLYKVDILQGYSGYLIKPKFFENDELWNYENAPQAALLVDDVWLSAQCKVQKFVIPAKRFCIDVYSNQKLIKRSSLGIQNSGKGRPENRNNSLMIKFFEKRWKSI